MIHKQTSVRRHRVLLACGLFALVWGLTTHGKYSDSGDEPHYLTITRSLVRDHDLDLANNYSPADPTNTEPAGHARVALDGRLQSVHDIGLPILLVPIYMVSQQLASVAPASLLNRFRMPRELFQYSLISLTMLAAVCVAVAWLAAALAHVTTHARALMIAGIVGSAPPVLSHSFLVFPETVALIVTCGVVWWLLSPAPAGWTTWALAAALGYLPWCHRKFSLFVIACAILMVTTRPGRGSWSTLARIGLSAVFVLPHVAFYWWTWRTWGNIGGPQMLNGVPFAAAGAARGFVGLLMDRQQGLIADAPIYIPIAACWALSKGTTRALLWAIASLVVPMSAFAVWWAGFSPAARYFVPIIPFCAVAIAESTRFVVIRVTTAILAVAQLFITAYAWQYPRALWPSSDGTNALLHGLGPVGRVYGRWLPALQSGDWRTAIVPVGALCGLNLILIWLASRPAWTASPEVPGSR